MIYFAGTHEKGFFAETVAKKFAEDVYYSGYFAHISDVKNEMLENKYSHIIIDVEPLIDNFDVIAAEVGIIKNVSNANIIVLAAGYNANTEIVQALLRHDIKNIILDSILSRQMASLELCITGKMIAPEILPDAEVDAPNNEPKSQLRRGIIAVGGCCSRIGTTTQAIQLVKYLTLKGCRAAYIEMNNSEYVNSLLKLYEIDSYDEELGKLTYMGVDMFNKKDKISEILKLDYEFFVYDFGSFKDKYFNPISYLEKDITIAVCGTSPGELECSTDVVTRTYNSDTYYIFNFCHETERADVLELMDNKADHTLFAGYTPDCFTYSSAANDIYEQIINPETKTPKKKKGFFRKEKRRNGK